MSVKKPAKKAATPAPKPVIVASSVLAGPVRCAKCGKIEGNHFFKTRHCAPHRDDVYEASK